MLILSRKKGESIIIKTNDKTIKIKILENNGDIKIGFEADKDIKIYRNELYEEIAKNNKQSISDLNSLNKIKNLFDNNENSL
ncbi:hypothetical protein OSSY52_05910 [Tepiditoga spiralis]|uniref:Translational regulator CsrA n=1 Tax=Tepiditoga spiralis TaxID=2108365 RepID=A0A7G1G283_9BACT|nr:carbon storage regulator [Tepiditoga spiralis]BBE30450.1 hypothetical protein OSSY52_05910 [Tepiditoga spiralis]